MIPPEPSTPYNATQRLDSRTLQQANFSLPGARLSIENERLIQRNDKDEIKRSLPLSTIQQLRSVRRLNEFSICTFGLFSAALYLALEIAGPGNLQTGLIILAALLGLVALMTLLKSVIVIESDAKPFSVEVSDGSSAADGFAASVNRLIASRRNSSDGVHRPPV